MRHAVLLLALAALAGCSGARPEAALPEMPAQTPRQLESTVTLGASLPYLLALPDGYHEGDEDWPLLLFLHGSGERGPDIERVKIHGPPKLIAAGQSLPFVVVSPQAPADGWWDAHVLAALLDEVIAEHRIDEDRVYVTGLSLGGFGTWELVSTYPERFAAAAPICGGGTPRKVCNARTVPIWAFHGDADTAVSVQRSEEMVMWLEDRCGGEPDVRLTVYPGVGHDSWTRTYENPELYEWLLSHRRGE